MASHNDLDQYPVLPWCVAPRRHRSLPAPAQEPNKHNQPGSALTAGPSSSIV
jgi:hypothetical protein